jgi:hypothetical protein
MLLRPACVPINRAALGLVVEVDPGSQMIDLLSARQIVFSAWFAPRLDAARGSLNGERYLISVALTIVVGILAYLGVAALVGVPVWAIVAFTVVASAAWWFLSRLAELTQERTPKLRFFTWENAPLRLTEDMTSAKVVYCVGLANEGPVTVRNVRVSIDAVEGYGHPTFPARLPIFRTAGDNADLHPGESDYFCVARIADPAGGDGGQASICCHGDLMKPAFPLAALEAGRTIALSAYGDGAPKASSRIRLSSRREAAAWSLDLELLPAAEEPPAPAETAPAASRPRPETTPAEQRPVRSRPVAEAPQAHSESVRRLLARHAQAS